MDFVRSLTSKYAVYFITGNHEIWSDKFHQLEPKLLDIGVKIFHNEYIKIHRNNDFISLIGIDDPGLGDQDNTEPEFTEKYLKEALKEVPNDEYKILLAHRPEYFSFYIENNIDLVLAGHTHGGQVRLPFIGSILVHHQPLFPKLSKGRFHEKNTTMIISGGLGTSRLPIRTFNLPEVVIITLDSEDKI